MPTVSIGTLGLTDAEVRVLKSLALMTKSRLEGCYTLGAAPDAADIVIVNVDDLLAAKKWHILATLPRPPMLLLYASKPPADPNQPYLLRPFGPGKLLGALDSISEGFRASAEVWQKPAMNQAAAVEQIAGGVRALVVDDSPTVCKQLELELHNFNIRADIAETGERALELLMQHSYDIIFLDVVLPGTDGYQVCREIRNTPRTKQTPVIMLTSKSSRFDRVRGSLVGCSTYLTKPVDYKDFRETVTKYVNADN